MAKCVMRNMQTTNVLCRHVRILIIGIQYAGRVILLHSFIFMGVHYYELVYFKNCLLFCHRVRETLRAYMEYNVIVKVLHFFYKKSLLARYINADSYNDCGILYL